MITFAIQCHNFQRRLCWQLSSICQQIDPPPITIDIAYMPHNGEPSTESVIAGFTGRRGLDIRSTVIEDPDIFAYRGLVRNIQVRKCQTEWIFFADCDNVYHPDFFRLLGEKLKTCNERNTYYSRAKRHTEVADTNAFAKMAVETHYIEAAYQRALKLPVIEKHNKKAAAGCMQVVKTEWCGGYYVKRSNDRNMLRDGQKARSDIRFRNRIGQSTELHLPEQVHMNHARDKELGYHTEEQR